MSNYRGGPPHRNAPAGYGDLADHFDTETLAEHAEGLLEGARAAHVQAHVDWCADCSGVIDQLRSVQSMLSSLPQPTLPPDVASRIDAGLARAQQERVEFDPAAQPEQPRRRSWLASLFTTRPQLIAGAAVLVVVLAFFGGYLTNQDGSGDDAAQSPTSQGAPPKQNAPMITGRQYTSGDFDKQARALVTDRKNTAYTPDPQAKAQLDAEVKRLSDPKELKKCVGALTGGQPSRIVAVDLGEFDKQPAAIVIMTIPDDAANYEVAAVGPGCTAGDAKVIHRKVVPKA